MRLPEKLREWLAEGGGDLDQQAMRLAVLLSPPPGAKRLLGIRQVALGRRRSRVGAPKK